MQLSIVIPCYNASKYLERCLFSIISQVKAEETEIIAIDDGSHDNTLSLLREFERSFSFIKVLSQSNAGPSVARNNGVEVAKGKYIWFVDSDDYIEDGAISKLIEVLNGNYDIIAFNHKENYASGLRYPNTYKTECLDAASLVAKGALYACNRIFKKSLFDIVKLPEDLINIEDFVFNVTVSPYVNKVLTLEDSLYFYEKTNENATSRNQNKRHLIRIHQDTMRAHKLLLRRMNDISDPHLKNAWQLIIHKSFSGCILSLLRYYNCRFVKRAITIYDDWGVYPFKYSGSLRLKAFTFFINHKSLWILSPLFKKFLF